MNDDRFYQDDPWPVLQKAGKPQKGELKPYSKKQKLQGHPVFDRQTLIENVAGAGRDLLGFSDDINDEISLHKSLLKKSIRAYRKAKENDDYDRMDMYRSRIKKSQRHIADLVDNSQATAVQRQVRGAAVQQGNRRAGGSSIHQPNMIHSTHTSQLRVKKPKSGGRGFKMPKIGFDVDDDYQNGYIKKRTDDVNWDNSQADWPEQMLQTALPYNSGLDARAAAMASGKVDMNRGRAIQDPRHANAPADASVVKSQGAERSTTPTDDYIVKNFNRVTGGGNLTSKAGTNLDEEEKVNW